MSARRASPAARWAGYIGLAIVFAVVCAFLSHWQFGRNAWRTEQLDLVAVNYDTAPVALSDLVPEGGTFDPADQWRQVTLTGSYLADQQLLARNRAHGGTAAYEILVPFRLEDGRVFIVDRGWELPGNTQPEPDDIPAPPSGEVTVVARLQPSEDLPSSGRTAPAGQVPTINLPLVATMLDPQDGSRLEQTTFGWLVSEDPAPAALPNAMEQPSVDPGPYLSYAIQWILFAIMGFIFIGYVIRSERRARREEAEEAAARAADPQLHDGDTASAPRTPRRPLFATRPDRDADDEDALLERADQRR